jgi:acyl-CoA synthetase (NDP forming)
VSVGRVYRGWAAQHQIGFKVVVSLGNEAVLDESDFTEA